MTESAYCWSRNKISNKDTYGALYNWYTVSTGELCPNGWHVPTYPEWDTLMTFLGGDTIAGISLKETGTAHWNSTSGVTNASGFTALGSSYRSSTGRFDYVRNMGVWWSSSEYSLTDAWYRNLISSTNIVGKNSISEKFGFSVRCLLGQQKNAGAVEEAFPGVQGELQDFIIDQDTITVEKINDKYVFQGDIILTEDQLNSGSDKGAGINSFINKWSCTVFYKINSNLMYRKGAILAAMQHIEAYTPLKFKERTDQQDYVEFVWDKDGCASYLGIIGGRQEIWIADWGKTGNIIHEIGHAIGLIHEHSRADRNGDVYIFYENIEPGNGHNFDITNTQYITNNFDFSSIMLYDSYAFSKNGLPTITKLDGSVFKSNRKALSVNDTAIINSIYDYEYNTIMDIDNNVYREVIIGKQKWMGENLKTTRYNTGPQIPLVTDSLEWPLLRTPGYCWKNNNEAAYKAQGAIYNWYAVNTGNLCPTGWHVPSETDWRTLILYLDPNAECINSDWWRSWIAGDKLREVGNTHWNYGGTDEFCFTAIQGSCRTTDWDGHITFTYHSHYNNCSVFWSAKEFDRSCHNDYWTCAYTWHLADNYYTFANSQFPKIEGFNVRCIKDQPAP
jgi:uncharacterized protein (TIGR02145 family)